MYGRTGYVVFCTSRGVIRGLPEHRGIIRGPPPECRGVLRGLPE